MLMQLLAVLVEHLADLVGELFQEASAQERVYPPQQPIKTSSTRSTIWQAALLCKVALWFSS